MMLHHNFWYGFGSIFNGSQRLATFKGGLKPSHANGPFPTGLGRQSENGKTRPSTKRISNGRSRKTLWLNLE
jgi:hypothetical protein